MHRARLSRKMAMTLRRVASFEAWLAGASIVFSARRTASSLTIPAMPKCLGGHRVATHSRDVRIAPQPGQDRRIDSISVPSTSRLAGALPLRYTSGQASTHRSNTPLTRKNSAKNTSCPCGVACAVSSQRTCMRPARVHHHGVDGLPHPRARLALGFTHSVSVPNPSQPTPVLAPRSVRCVVLPSLGR